MWMKHNKITVIIRKIKAFCYWMGKCYITSLWSTLAFVKTKHLRDWLCVSTRCVRLTVLQAHPQLFVVFLLHVVDDLALVFEGIGLFDAGHEVSLDHRAGRTVEQVTIWKILIQTQAFSLRTATLYLPIKGQRNVNSYLFSLYLKAIRITNCPKSCNSFI